MANYSIRELEQISGIKAHTIRIWEKRFKILMPNRSNTNIRNYDSEHLKLMLNIALLKDHGYKISEIATLSHQQIDHAVINIADQKINFPDQVISLTKAMVELDEEYFEKILNENTQKFGFETVMIEVIYPFLSRIGSLWITNSIGPAQEHFMASLIRQKIIVAIDLLPKTTKPNKTFVLYLPEGEYHEIGLLFAYYLLKSRHHKVVYLGQSLPINELHFVCKIYKPHAIFTSITSVPNYNHVQKYVDNLAAQFRNTNILLTGYQVINNEIILPKSVSLIKNIQDLIKLLELLG